MSALVDYLFVSERLGFRNWSEADVISMSKISGNAEVMEFFPSTQSQKHTQAFVARMMDQFETSGFCYFAVERLADGAFIGFLGLSRSTFESDFAPCIDIGWRFDSQFWNNGYATEGGKRCLRYAFETLNLSKVFSIASIVNVKSELIMKKIGMEKEREFDHPLLKEFPRIEACVLYSIDKENYERNTTDSVVEKN